MKQRISVEQLQELSEEQKEKLHQWLYSKTWESSKEEQLYFRHYVVDVGAEGEEIALPLLSIGQMIGYLKDYHISIRMPAGIYGAWKIDVYIGQVHRIFKSNELCDALWEAVKATL